MGRNLPDYTQILYKIQIQPSKPQPARDAPGASAKSQIKGPLTRYGVDFAVALEDLRLSRSSDAIILGAIEVMLLVYDSEGKPLNMIATRSEIRIPEKDYPGVQKQGLQIHEEIDVPNGDMYLRTGIYDLKSGSVGTLGIPLTALIPTAAK